MIFLWSMGGIGFLPSLLPFRLRQNSKPYQQNTLRKIWHEACKKAGVPKIKLYNASRHSLASQLGNANTPIEIVSKLLGHSSIQMT